MRILIVEDNSALRRDLQKQLARSGFQVVGVPDLAQAERRIESEEFDFALLDRRLPDGDGLKLAPILRQMHPRTRILMLTALDEEDEKITGLDAGADDYLTKPLNFNELLARIRAHLRRLDGDHGPAIRLGNLSFDPGSREVSVSGGIVQLQKRELELLEALMRRAGRMTLRERLGEDIYGASDEVHCNRLNVLVSQLRRRLKELGAEVEIHTTRGVGYFIAKAVR
jgi:two-component system, OmpR family, response regulator